MLWLNWKAEIDKKKKKEKECEQGREWERTDNEQMTSWKGRFMLASEKECSQSMVKGKRGNESMWVGERRGESTLYSLGCQFTSKPSQPPTSQSCLKGCCFGCRVPTTTYRQTEWVWDLPDESTFIAKTHQALSASLLLTQCPLNELCWIKFGGKKTEK